MSDHALVRGVAGRVEVHVVGRGGRRGFPVVERRHLATRRAMHDEPTAPDVAGVRQHDLEREGDGDGGVDGVAALLEDVDARLTRERMCRDDHCVRRGDRA